MTLVHVYRDPSRRSRHLNLVEGVTGASASRSFRLEDQLTEIVAWIADRSDAFARQFVHLFIRDDEEAVRALKSSEVVGAETQIMLPRLGSRLSRVDLSVAGSERAFQILIEVKVGADFTDDPQREGSSTERSISQPERYCLAWDQADPGREAVVRRVATLTLDGAAPAFDHRFRTGDVRWLEVAHLVAELDGHGSLQGEVAEVARELRDFLLRRFTEPTLPRPDFLEWAGKLARAVVQRVQVAVSDPVVTGTFKPVASSHYAGGFLEFTSPAGIRDKLWIYVTVAGAAYNRPGDPHSLWLSEYNEQPLSGEAALRLERVGFETVRDRAGYRMRRLALPLEELDQAESFDTEAELAGDWAFTVLQEAGLTKSA